VKVNDQSNPRGISAPRAGAASAFSNRSLRGIVVQSFRPSAIWFFWSAGTGPIRPTTTSSQGSGPNVSNPEVWEMERSLLIESST